jgi:hypothetical protein
MRRLFPLLLAAGLIFMAVVISLGADGGKGNEDDENDRDGERAAYAIGLWGDLPTHVGSGFSRILCLL